MASDYGLRLLNVDGEGDGFCPHCETVDFINEIKTLFKRPATDTPIEIAHLWFSNRPS